MIAAVVQAFNFAQVYFLLLVDHGSEREDEWAKR